MTLGTSVGASSSYFTPPIPHVLVPAVAAAIPSPVPMTIGDDWQAASALASAIENRAWAEIPRAVAAIDEASPYAAWVPAALELAVEQLDATAAGYRRMNMCGELTGFLARVESEWPQGRKAMQPARCLSGCTRSAASEARYAVLAGELARAIAADDHQSALDACGAMRLHGSLPASCLVQACRARELAVAEVVAEDLRAEPADLVLAWRACQHLGVVFYGGHAHALRGSSRHPVELVRVHPDAPPTR